jgi:integrase
LVNDRISSVRSSPARADVRSEASDGIPDAMRFDDLRHTCAAILLDQGAHTKAMQERLGHSSIEVTRDTYGHLDESTEDALADALDAVHAAAVASAGSKERGLRAV